MKQNQQKRKEQIERIVTNEIHDSNGNNEMRQQRDPINEQREEIKLHHVEKRIKSMLKSKKYKKKVEEGKDLICVEQEFESFPVTKKDNEEPIFVWTTNPPENVLLVDKKKPTCEYSKSTTLELFKVILPESVTKKIKDFTNERIEVEKDISIDLYYMKTYTKIFNEMEKVFDGNEMIDEYILEESNIETLKEIYSHVDMNSDVAKLLKLLIESPKQYMINEFVFIFHLEKLKYFVDNHTEFDKIQFFITKISELHNSKYEPRIINPVTRDEIIHYFGVLIYMGVKKYSNIQKAYETDTVLKFHSLRPRRFKEIGRCIRFDSIYDRDEDDPLAPVKFLVDSVNKKMQEIYTPSGHFTLDEHIIPFCGRFSCLVYIKDKPHSRGLRVDCLNDCQTGFLYKFVIYGKRNNEMEEEIQNDYVQLDETQIIEMTQIQSQQTTTIIENTQIVNDELKKPKKQKKTKKKRRQKKNTKYNYQYSMNEGMVLSTTKHLLNEFVNPIQRKQTITSVQLMEEENETNVDQQKPKVLIGMDNYYTTKGVVDYLNENNIGFVGTVRINRPFVSEKFKNLQLELHQSLQVTHENMTLVNYKAKKEKNVFIMSNQIDALRKCIGNKEKPEIVLLYNSVKGATDRYDHLISNLDIRRKSNRFQLAVLYDILNIILTNILIIKRMEEPDLNHEEVGYELAMSLLGETIEQQIPTVCCTTMEEEVNCKKHNGFIIIRENHPEGQKSESRTTKQICCQCGKTIKPRTCKKITLKFCETCFKPFKIEKDDKN